MLLNRIAVSIALLAAAAAAFADTNFPPNLSDKAKAAFLEKYEPASREKAFAITQDGSKFFYITDQKSDELAARMASVGCLKAHTAPCHIWFINGKDVLGDYESARVQSEKAIASLPAELTKKSYANEDADMGVTFPNGLRELMASHGATPATAPSGAKIISTAELVNLYRSDTKLVVLDVLPSQGVKKSTLPGALWVNTLGVGHEKLNTIIELVIPKTLAVVVPDKSVPIVSYCAGWECWFSWNATVRLVAAGYKNVYWYRGGLDSWLAAKLPQVETPIALQML